MDSKSYWKLLHWNASLLIGITKLVLGKYVIGYCDALQIHSYQRTHGVEDQSRPWMELGWVEGEIATYFISIKIDKL